MRTALILLLLMAIAAIPGSLFPQRQADPNGVVKYFDDNPELAPTIDTLQLFDVYSSAWFSAIYLLLFVSLIGCIIPRTVSYTHLDVYKRQEEQCRLQAFAPDAEEGDGGDGQWSGVDRTVELAGQLAGEPATHRAHPEHLSLIHI